MLLRRVIPCLDVDKGRVVKGVEFVNLRDAGDPVELAVRYQDEGADEIVFLDITASHERRETVAELARRCADDVFIPFTIGGGVRSAEDAQAVLDAGADKVSVNSRGGRAARAARRDGRGVRRPVRGAGDRRPPRARRLLRRLRGGRRAGPWGATRSSGRARESSAGRGRSCSPAWTATGPRTATSSTLTRAVADAVDVPVIASGGAGTLDHLVEAVTEGGADAVLCASIFHYGGLHGQGGQGAHAGGRHPGETVRP